MSDAGARLATIAALHAHHRRAVLFATLSSVWVCEPIALLGQKRGLLLRAAFRDLDLQACREQQFAVDEAIARFADGLTPVGPGDHRQVVPSKESCDGGWSFTLDDHPFGRSPVAPK